MNGNWLWELLLRPFIALSVVADMAKSFFCPQFEANRRWPAKAGDVMKKDKKGRERKVWRGRCTRGGGQMEPCECCGKEFCKTWRELQRARWELQELYRVLDELDALLPPPNKSGKRAGKPK